MATVCGRQRPAVRGPDIFGMQDVVACGGGAWVQDERGPFRAKDVLPAPERGACRMAIQDDVVNVRVDFRWGKNDGCLTIAVSEAF